MKKIEEILQTRTATPNEALEVFDKLEVANIDFMLGRWKGFDIETGHKMDGLLVPSGWYGKLFKNSEEVHPLLFYAKNKTNLYSVNPKFLPLKIKFPKSNVIGIIIKLARPVLQTNHSKARLRMVEYRSKVTASMCYDEKAIIDHFAKIDENTVMGIMDQKGDIKPYFFILERDNQSDLKQTFKN